MLIMQHVKRTYTYTNTTNSEWHLVGNHHSVISTHAGIEQAKLALSTIDVDDSPWGVIQIVAPGNTVSGELVHTEWEPGEKEANEAATKTWLEQWLK